MTKLTKEGPMLTYRHRGCYIPDHMMEGLRDYIVYGHEPGSFLTAVICNNLIDACAHADEENARNLPAYAAFIYNDVPSGCWGSRDRMNAWMEERRAWWAEQRRSAVAHAGAE